MSRAQGGYMIIPGYPKVYAIGKTEILDLFKEPCVIEEKIDGSQFSFMKKDGVLYCRTHKQMLDMDTPEKMFTPAVETVKRLENLLVAEWVYRGEAVCKPKHNVLAYDRVPPGFIILYDIETRYAKIGPPAFLSTEAKHDEANRLGLMVVPQLAFRGTMTSVEEMSGLLETWSCLGGQKIEGFVAKNYQRRTADGKVMMGKYVSERFKEVHNQQWKVTGNKGIRDEIGDKLRSEARWDKAVQHLRERGELLDEPKDIGALIKEVCQDVFEEEGELIKTQLLKWAKKKITQRLTAGLAEWYKQRLAARAFGGGGNE